MATIQILDPIPRIEGHLRLEVTLDTVGSELQVVEARACGTMFRGFELLLQGRPPLDGPHLTQRICGVCPVSHGLVAVRALESLGSVAVPDGARHLRNLVLGANFVASHLLHFYHLSLLDFVAGPDRPPWTPRWTADLRVGGAAAAALTDHYVAALAARRKAHELGAAFGGRLPHPPTYVPGGFTTTPRAERIARCQSLLAEIRSFVEGTWLPDVEVLASAYGDYYAIGTGPENLLAFGGFDLDATAQSQLFPRGRIEAGASGVLPVDLGAVTETVRYGWYEDGPAPLAPAEGRTVIAHTKDDAYSWIKAPRYLGEPYEVGPLARMWVAGEYDHGISVLDRHAARAAEALKIVTAMGDWLAALDPGAPVCVPYDVPSSGEGSAVVEAPRGALGHWLSLGGGTFDHYQVVTPTAWNGSPRDGNGIRGPIEQALVGTPIGDEEQPIELLRVVHSFDPCLACAVHVMRPRGSRA